MQIPLNEEILDVELLDALSRKKFIELCFLPGGVFRKAILNLATDPPVMIALRLEAIDAQMERGGPMNIGLFHWSHFLAMWAGFSLQVVDNVSLLM